MTMGRNLLLLPEAHYLSDHELYVGVTRNRLKCGHTPDIFKKHIINREL
jgi:hypothetical protein